MKNYSIFKHSFCTLSLFIVMLLHAGVTYAQEKLRISFSNVSLEEALKKIESASNIPFSMMTRERIFLRKSPLTQMVKV